MLNLSYNLIQKFKRKIFPFYKSKELKKIFEILQKGHPKNIVTSRFVGGCVRKHLLGEKVDDIDVATILTTDQIKERFKDTNFKVIETGVKHGTLTIVSKNFKVELTTLRKDVKTDGRHAEVKYIDSWQLDSERRDFTINAIYLDISGKVFDPQMGTIDLKNNNVKFIGDPQKRIEEDYLRIIRFIRFKLVYDLKIEPTTYNAIKSNLDGIQRISKERILEELFKILKNKNFLNINRSSHLKEIFLLIFPEFLYLSRLDRLKKIYDFSLINDDILLAVLLLDGKDNHEYFAFKYNIPKKVKENLEKVALNLNQIRKDKNFLSKDLHKNIYKNGKKYLIALNLINFSINSKIKVDEFNDTLNEILKCEIPEFHIDGKYLKENGMQEGEALGKVLQIIEDEWLDNSFKISDERVKELIRNNTN